MNRKLHPITEEQITNYIKRLGESYGGELGHMEADEILCDILNELGLMDIVDAYDRVPDKYYA